MEQTIPKLMSIGQFCQYSGLSRWRFRSLADRHHLKFVEKGRAKLVDVQLAMALLPRIVEQEMIEDPRPELIERLKAAVAADQQEEPQNAA
jgi:hypothetical protein